MIHAGDRQGGIWLGVGDPEYALVYVGGGSGCKVESCRPNRHRSCVSRAVGAATDEVAHRKRSAAERDDRCVVGAIAPLDQTHVGL
jgi:hypothetical protein